MTAEPRQQPAVIFVERTRSFIARILIQRASRVTFIDAIILILLFCVLLGLSMDYEGFLLSRIRGGERIGEDSRS
jgi:uncharacterized membrane protein YdfJ with MMPL/SSD domain